MQILVVGAGKLATEILTSLPQLHGDELFPWSERDGCQSVVLHCGSGRELPDVLRFCELTGSTLIELSTGAKICEPRGFPLISCPNTNILMVKLMAMFGACGDLWRPHEITITESHQANKRTLPGTAARIASSLGIPQGEIRSIRDPLVQQRQLRIPSGALRRHAYHLVQICDGTSSIRIEARVEGEQPYVAGVASILWAVRNHELENRTYSVEEFVQEGWI